MSDFEAIADRVEIEALRGEFTDAAMMRDYDRLASLFTPDGALRIPYANVELAGREEIRAWGERVPAVVDYLVQTTHPGTIRLDGDTASGRAYICELIRLRDGSSHLNYAIRYLDTAPLADSAPHASGELCPVFPGGSGLPGGPGGLWCTKITPEPGSTPVNGAMLQPGAAQTCAVSGTAGA